MDACVREVGTRRQENVHAAEGFPERAGALSAAEDTVVADDCTDCGRELGTRGSRKMDGLERTHCGRGAGGARLYSAAGAVAVGSDAGCAEGTSDAGPEMVRALLSGLLLIECRPAVRVPRARLAE